jgi:cytochrome P450 family 6
VQNKLREKINKELIDSNGKINYEKMLDHEYLDQVFYEALRLHPPLGIYNRECNEQIVLEGAKGKKFVVPKDFSVNIPVHSIQRDSEIFPNPDEFIPERFDPENGGVKAFADRGALIPFGDGPR